MPAPYGVTPTGYSVKTAEEIQTDMEAAARAELGDTIDLNPETSVLAQTIGIVSDRLADAHQLGAGIYAAAFPASAGDVSLDQGAALTGTVRAPATRSTVTITFTGTPGTLIPTGTKVSNHDVPDSQFRTTFDLNISGLGTATTGLEAVSFGPILAPAGSITQIDTPVSGLSSVTNGSDQDTIGQNAELDPPLRLRQREGLRAQGRAAFEAIRAALLDPEIIAGVSDAFVFENDSDDTIDTIPPHAFECVVRGGTDAAVAAVIFAYKPAGIRAFGTDSIAVSDSQGDSHDIGFTRPTQLNIYVIINVTVNANAPRNIADLIKAAVVAYGDLNYRTGSKVIAQALVPTIFGKTDETANSGIVGVTDVSPPLIGTAPAPGTSVTISPTKRQIADLDTSRVTVNVTRV